MKQFLLFPLLSIGILPMNNPTVHVEKTTTHYSSPVDGNNGLGIGGQTESGGCRMSAAMFKNQEFCRAELKDFDFDAHYSIVGATVYFSGANFDSPKQGTLTGSSLKPIKSLMDHCTPGSIIIFDDVKVVGPDKVVRTIPGISIMLY
jgi:hypothetical protein